MTTRAHSSRPGFPHEQVTAGKQTVKNLFINAHRAPQPNDKSRRASSLANPSIHVYGVEPVGADAMGQSFAANHTVKMGPMHSIADSLMAPHTEEYSYELCRRHIDRLVTVSDAELRHAMLLLFDELKLAVEPSAAAATAALLGPLRDACQGKRVGVLLCGTNTDPVTFTRHLGMAALGE